MMNWLIGVVGDVLKMVQTSMDFDLEKLQRSTPPEIDHPEVWRGVREIQNRGNFDLIFPPNSNPQNIPFPFSMEEFRSLSHSFLVFSCCSFDWIIQSHFDRPLWILN